MRIEGVLMNKRRVPVKVGVNSAVSKFSNFLFTQTVVCSLILFKFDTAMDE
jgi:hypothetical protein